MLCHTTLLSLLAALNAAVSAAPISTVSTVTGLDKAIIVPGPIVPDNDQMLELLGDAAFLEDVRRSHSSPVHWGDDSQPQLARFTQAFTKSFREQYPNANVILDSLWSPSNQTVTEAAQHVDYQFSSIALVEFHVVWWPAGEQTASYTHNGERGFNHWAISGCFKNEPPVDAKGKVDFC